MLEKVITDNACERITVKWDGERFGITLQVKTTPITPKRVIILIPKEMLELIQFASKLGGNSGYKEG